MGASAKELRLTVEGTLAGTGSRSCFAFVRRTAVWARQVSRTVTVHTAHDWSSSAAVLILSTSTYSQTYIKYL